MADELPEPLLTRGDVQAIFLWMADVIDELRGIRRLLEEGNGQEEEE